MSRAVRLIALVFALTAARAEAQDGGVITAPVVTRDATPLYPPELADAGIDTEVTLELVLDETGALEHAAVREPADPFFAREALHAVAAMRFDPARLDGTPVSVQLEYRVHFVAPVAPTPPDAGTPAFLVGEVRSRGTRTPIPLARLTTDAGHEIFTAPDGTFRLALPAGMHTVDVAAPGFFPTQFTETLDEGVEVKVRYALQPRQQRPFETVVRGERERSELGRVSLHDAELTDVAGTGGDPLKVLMVLPGVSSIASGAAYPVVRGSGPAATGYYLDGVRVPQLFHVFLGPAVIHPALIEGLDFYAGGAPVKYGRLLGGAVDAITKAPSETFHAQASVDLLNAGALVDIPIERTGTSVTLAGRYGYSGFLLGPISTAFNPAQRLIANFWDYQGRIEQKVGDGRLRLFAFGSSDDFGTQQTGLGSRPPSTGTQSVKFHRVDLRYRRDVLGGPFEIGATFGQDLFGFYSEGPARQLGPITSPDARSEQTTTITQWLASARTSWHVPLSKAFTLGAGATFDQVRASANATVTFNQPGFEPVTNGSDRNLAIGTYTAAWTQLQFTGVERFSATAGVRVDNFHLVPGIDQTSADPRLSLEYRPTDRWTLRAAGGLYHQPPTFLITLPVVDVASLRYGLQEVAQFSAGSTLDVWRGLQLSADVYFNPMGRTAEYGIFDDEVARDIDPRRQNGGLTPDRPPVTGTGRAYGVDLMVRWPMKDRFFGWLTFSVQRSERYQRYRTIDAEGEFGPRTEGWLPYTFDQTFVANAVLGYRFDNGFSVGTTLHFNTGRPESGQFGSRTMIPGTLDNGQSYWVQLARNQVDRLPPYFRADVRASKTWLFDDFSLELYLDVLNVTVRQEVIGFDYEGGAGEPLQKLPQTIPVVFPSLGLIGRY